MTFNVGSYSTTYQHLQIRSLARNNVAGSSNNGLYLQFNNDTGNNYAFHRLEGAASVVSIGVPNTSGILIGIALQNSATSNAFAASVADILDPYETTKNKTVRALSGVLGGSVPAVALQSGFRNNTEAISSIKLYPDAGNFVQGSRFSIYGLKN